MQLLQPADVEYTPSATSNQYQSSSQSKVWFAKRLFFKFLLSSFYVLTERAQPGQLQAAYIQTLSRMCGHLGAPQRTTAHRPITLSWNCPSDILDAYLYHITPFQDTEYTAEDTHCSHSTQWTSAMNFLLLTHTSLKIIAKASIKLTKSNRTLEGNKAYHPITDLSRKKKKNHKVEKKKDFRNVF